MHAKGFWKTEIVALILIFGFCILWNSKVKAAGYEEVEIVNVQTVTVLSCPAVQRSQPQQPQGIAGTNVTAPQVAGAMAGAVGGAYACGQIAGPKYETYGRILCGVAGGAAGYVLMTPDQQPMQAQNCQQVPRYKVTYKRRNGMSGDLLMTNRTVAKSMVINFCQAPQGQMDQPC